MMKCSLLKIILGFSACLSLSANAALNLELTQGINAAIPIAIVPFAGESNAPVPGNTQLTTVIRTDLQNSGQFQVKSPGLLTDTPSDVSQVNVANWRKQAVNDLIIGKVADLGGGRFQVSVDLIDLYKATPGQPANSAVLMHQVFTTTQAGLRKLAHHISDLIYQQITGVRGVFSTKIAYILVQPGANETSKYSLEVADADGFAPRPLLISPLPIMSPSWSPNGHEIAYVSFENNEASIFLQDVRTAQRHLISKFPGINGAPAFSPDGRKVALVLTTSGNPKIYLMDLASRQLTQLTNGFSIDTEPSFAPDGKSILFTSSRGGTPQIYRYDMAGGQVSRITFDGNYNARASYLPDQQSIIMMHRETGIFGIAKQDLSNGQVQVLTQSGNDESPSLAPNGKMVLYATEYSGRGVLGVVSTDARIRLILPAREGSVQEPAWSPFLPE